MSNKVYDVLKWIDGVLIYAILYAWTELARVWDFPYSTQIGQTITIVGGALGILLGVSSLKYNLKLKAEKQTENDPEPDENAE